MTNWRTNLGGAISLFGSGLFGVGVIPQLASGVPNKFLIWVAFSGYVLEKLGGSITALFAADAKTVSANQAQIQELQMRSNLVPNSIESGDTTFLPQSPITPAVVPPPVTPPIADPPKTP